MGRWGVAVFLVVGLVLSACGSDDRGSATDGSGGDPIDGRYRLVAGAGYEDVDAGGQEISLEIADGDMSISGCGEAGATVDVVDGVLRVEESYTAPGGCLPPGPIGRVVALVASEPAIEVTDDRIVLRSETDSATFDRVVPEPDRKLMDTVWVVSSFVDGRDEVGTVAASAASMGRIVFEPNGFVSGNDGCNDLGYGGPTGEEPTDGLRYERAGDQLTFTGSPISTQIGCDRDVEPFHAVLSGTVDLEIAVDRLTLTAGDRAVQYTAEGD